ncbi:MAG: hypothetical protein K1Y02_00280 [Candidatus Hydrogenedentes bacterium]|nr:hypothetical protein [Candidatus Hydrogenedentota bacterium]
MQFLRNAIDAVQRNLLPVGIYCGAAALAVLLSSMADAAVLQQTGMDNKDLQIGAYGLLSSLFFIAVLAAVRCVVFARMGKEIDKPLWRIRDDWEATKRFLPMWILLDFVTFAAMWLRNPELYGGKLNAISAICHIVALVMNIATVPIGACIMFTGHFQWQRLSEALSPLSRQLQQSGIVLAVCVFQLVVHDAVASHILSISETPGPLDGLPHRIALIAVMAYLECVIFAAVWLLCMADRETPNDIDFDF